MAAKVPSVKRYVVRLSAEERLALETMIRKGKSPAQRLLKARILLKADVSEDGEGWSDSRIIEALETSISMVYRVRKQLVEEGLEAVLSRKAPAAPAVPRIFDGEKEARLIALACSKPPEGYARWSLRLLESKVVELGIVEAASDSTIQRVLKKSSPAAPPQILGYPAQGEWRVRSGDGGRAVGLREATRPRPPAGLSGRDVQAARRRNPLAGGDWARAAGPRRLRIHPQRRGQPVHDVCSARRLARRQVTDRRTAVDYAHVLKDLADVHFAQAKTIILVQDNLNTHAAASLYEAFPAAQARRLVERFEWHYTPKHGSWLDLAESELGVLASQCLDRRIPDKQTIITEVAAWVRDRNKNHAVAEWHFATHDARIKLKRLYPSL